MLVTTIDGARAWGAAACGDRADPGDGSGMDDHGASAAEVLTADAVAVTDTAALATPVTSATVAMASPADRPSLQANSTC